MTARVSEQGSDTANPRHHRAKEGGNDGVAKVGGPLGEVELGVKCWRLQRTQEVISSDLTTQDREGVVHDCRAQNTVRKETDVRPRVKGALVPRNPQEDP